MQTTKFRTTLIILTSKIVFVALLVLGIFYYLFFRATIIATVSIIIGILAAVSTSLLVKRNQHLTILLLYIYCVAATLFTTAKTGGILSPVWLWISITPIFFGFVFKNRNHIFSSGIFAIFASFFVYFVHFENIFTDDQLRMASLLAISAICLTNILLTFAFHKELEQEKTVIEDQMRKLQSMEAEMVQKEKMATIGLIASGVAHQLGNTLNTISSIAISLEMRAQKSESVASNVLTESLESVTKALTLSASIIRGLDFAAKQNSTNHDLKIHDVVNTSIILIRGKNLEKCEVVNQIDKELIIYSNESSLLQIFMNLISNTVDALGQRRDGRVTISNQGPEIIYKDNAGGIPEAIYSKLFQPFNTSKSSQEGTGLGLYIIKKEVEACDGTIAVTNVDEGVEIKLIFKEKK